jgi:hypothetical protein
VSKYSQIVVNSRFLVGSHCHWLSVLCEVHVVWCGVVWCGVVWCGLGVCMRYSNLGVFADVSEPEPRLKDLQVVEDHWVDEVQQ